MTSAVRKVLSFASLGHIRKNWTLWNKKDVQHIRARLSKRISFHTNPTPINISSLFRRMLSLLRKTTCMVSAIQTNAWYVPHPTLNSRDILTSPAKPLTYITKPHDHKTGNRKRPKIYRMSQEEWTKLRESVPCVELYRYNPKHLYPKLNGYGDNGHRKVWASGVSASGVSTYCKPSMTPYSSTVHARQRETTS